jgi:hypothetical protein
VQQPNTAVAISKAAFGAAAAFFAFFVLRALDVATDLLFFADFAFADFALFAILAFFADFTFDCLLMIDPPNENNLEMKTILDCV